MPALKAASADQLVAAAAQHFHAGRLAKAESLLLQLLAAQPHHAVALHLLGVIAHLSDQHETAFDLVSRSLAANPTDATTHSSLGNLLLFQGRLDEAAASYRRALRFNPALPEALVGLGNALRGLKSVGGSRGQLPKSDQNSPRRSGYSLLSRDADAGSWRYAGRVGGA